MTQRCPYDGTECPFSNDCDLQNKDLGCWYLRVLQDPAHQRNLREAKRFARYRVRELWRAITKLVVN